MKRNIQIRLMSFGLAVFWMTITLLIIFGLGWIVCSIYIYEQERLILHHIQVRDYRGTITEMINYRNYTKTFLPAQQQGENAEIWKYLVSKVNATFGDSIRWD